MKMLVESLKRMYKKGTLTKDEYEYITGETLSGGGTE